MVETENLKVIAAITIAVVLLVALVLITARLLGNVIRLKYSPFEFANRFLNIENETPIRISTPLAPRDVEHRLRGKIGRIGVPFFMSQRLVGRVVERNVQVRLHRPFLNDSLAPEFSGLIETEAGHTVLKGTFRLNKVGRNFMKFWFGINIVWGTVGIPAGLFQITSGQWDGVLNAMSPLLMFCLGVYLLRRNTRDGEEIEMMITQELSEAISGVESTR